MAYLSNHPASKKRKTPFSIKNRTPLIRAKKSDKLVCLTAYTAIMAQIMDSQVDLILVGDSVNTVLYGEPTTLNISPDVIARHALAVVKATQEACVVFDLPFGTYQTTPVEAFKQAAHALSTTGANAVKLEGGVEMAETVAFLTQRGIPVLGHIGLLPQHVSYAGYRIRGRDPSDIDRLIEDARALEEAGAFGLVLEAVRASSVPTIMAATNLPIIGIGASAECDGQILVLDDMLGLLPHPPKFVKPYAAMGEVVLDAITRYAQEVKSGEFPSQAHLYPDKPA